MKYPLIVFDWDGTLYDSSAYIVSCLQDAAQEVGLCVPDAEKIRDMIGLSSQESMKYLFPNITAFESARLSEAYRNQLHVVSRQPTLFDGAKEMIKTLNDDGHTLAIATGKGRKLLDNDLSSLGLTPFFSVTRCADECFSKPHPQMLQEILEETQMTPEQALVVGDTEYDMNMAKSAHVDALAVSYGVHELSRMTGPNIIGHLHDIREIRSFLL